MANGREDLEHFIALWDKSREKIEKIPKKIVENKKLSNGPKSANIDDIVYFYLEQQDVLGKVEKEELISEGDLTTSDLAKAGTRMASTPNPVQPTSLGKDQKLTNPDEFANGDKLDKLSKMKKDLHDLQDDLMSSYVMKPKSEWGKIQAKIDDLKEKIEDLSDSLPPNIFYDDDEEELKGEK